jgi:hypothetical protein
MPQSTHDRTAELHNIPEHAAESAATSHTKAPHLSAHEETVQAEEHARNSAEATTMHHGKAASIAAKK